MSKFIKTSIKSIIPFISLLFLNFFNLDLSYANVQKCGFKSDHSIYLFSGPVAALLYRMSLFDDPQIKGIFSTYQFKPVKNKKIFTGGIYLSQKLAEEIEDNAIIFHEETRELESTLNHVHKRLKKKWTIKKLITRNKTPKEVSLDTLELIHPYLLDNATCRELVAQLKTKISSLQDTLSQKSLTKHPIPKVYFFLGKWQGNMPEANALIIYQEGFLQELIAYNVIAKYETQEVKLNYAPWSAKQFHNQKAIYVGVNSELTDQGQTGALEKTRLGQYQSNCFACLIPGILQLEWISKIKF